MPGAIISVKFNFFFIKTKKKVSQPEETQVLRICLQKRGTLLSTLNKLQLKHDQAPNYLSKPSQELVLPRKMGRKKLVSD